MRGIAPQAGIAGAAGASVASFRRFWVVAARCNSSRAPLGPRNRSRLSFRMRLRCANNISTFFALAPRGLIGLNVGNLAGQVARAFRKLTVRSCAPVPLGSSAA
jgi:hypothetical protein